MRTKKIFILIVAIFLLLHTNITYAQQDEKCSIEFRPSSDMLYDRYGNNILEIKTVKQFVSYYEDIILTGNGHIRLIVPIGCDGKENLVAMNLAALRAAVIRSFLKQNFRMLTDWNFTFYLDSTRVCNNTVEVHYIPYSIPASVSSSIYYTEKKSDLLTIKRTLSKYGKLPYLSDAPIFKSDLPARAHFDRINAIATNPVDVELKGGELNPEKLLIAIHYRWDKDNLDSLYLSNPENLHLLDSILISANSKYIDTLTIVAYASPEGQPDYNKRLSERRAQTIKDYITNNYKTFAPERIIIEARGENWEGLRNFAMNDSELPSRVEVLNIINSSLDNEQKQSLLTKLDGGVTYYRYILPNYYRYLRNGASVLITYSPSLPKGPEFVALSEPEPEPQSIVIVEPKSKPIVRYPVAFKTNLLFDAIGAFNISVEVPIGNHFSVVGDFAYAYWRSSQNRYALQTLEGGVEGRYWFGVKDKEKLKNPEWAKPLRGWNVGIYGMYCSRYDVQWIDGYQGDGFWSVGVTGGYAVPVARNLTIELSLAAGYFYTAEYRHYHEPEFDANGKYHLMWQKTGNFGMFTLTKARISLVWLIRKEKKGEQK